jgi:hypothetical protein
MDTFKTKITARLRDFDTRDKHYGTHIELLADGQPCGNDVKIWYTADMLGGQAPSRREGPEPDLAGNHYETLADLTVAEAIVAAINAANIEVELPDDDDEVFG